MIADDLGTMRANPSLSHLYILSSRLDGSQKTEFARAKERVMEAAKRLAVNRHSGMEKQLFGLSGAHQLIADQASAR